MSKKINRITPLNEISNMAGLTVTTALTDLKVLFNDLKEVYFKAGEIKTSDLGSEALTMDMELPALDDGVTFDTGSADVTRVRITTKAVWTSKASKGDPDITFQVATFLWKTRRPLQVPPISSTERPIKVRPTVFLRRRLPEPS